MNHPYQIVSLCRAQHFGPKGLLLAACGAQILCIKLSDGSILSQWQAQKANDSIETASDAPSGKKRKLEPEASAASNVIKLTVASNDKYAVAVTDDKSVRVLEITESGKLHELSERTMPKRPCAILVTPDNQTILCGDKFGDVYSLPLLPSASVESGQETPKSEITEDPTSKKYVPSATTLTVHSGRNRRALENQMRQKNLQAKAREGPKFEHQLLLGHVSMLTDVQFATEEVVGKQRGYIITADRDEHIRISRGPPQAHIVEGFCLGHKEFISKVCLLSKNELLASGGGDDWLGIWDWRSGNLKEKRDMRSALTTLFSSQPDSVTFDSESPIAVSGIWAVHGSAENDAAILIACEKLPCLLVSSQGSSSMVAVHLPGTPLDVAVIGHVAIVSMDVVESSSPRLQAYRVLSSGLELEEGLCAKLQAANGSAIAAPERKQLDNLLYGMENLRKRSGQDEQDDA